MKNPKFRIWNKAKKDWEVEGFSLIGETMLLQGFPISELNNLEVNQFTGLLDKNKVEIYKADFVKIHNLKETWKRGEPDFDWRILQVIWNRYTYAYDNSVLYKCFSDYDGKTLEPFDIEVIGNIYQNPELIK